MTSLADKIMKRVTAHDSGSWVCTPKDFLHLGSREAVDQALSRLVKAGQLRRVGHGLYDMPRISNVLKRPAPVDMNAAIAALARRDSARIMPDGLVSANQLGLTNAVPATVSFVTDGHSRTVKIGGRTLQFRHAGPSVMQWTGRPAAPVVQALRWLGPDAAADERVLSTLSRCLPDDVKRALLQNSRDLPGWALPLARKIASGPAVAE
ncbi:MAG: type IV toxin-antitoxin system AbiEi family antitoxin domain-containing protein [Pseudomonadales bacterium]|nr:type IV toxin-antitoxin system AbiEi family antitoxin domain-containing protein [Pseudomonadales bacterium]